MIPQRLQQRMTEHGVAIPVLAVLLLAHLAFGLVRLPYGGVAKRARLATQWHETDPVSWHFQLTDEETRRVAAWLCNSVGEQEVVLYRGSQRGYIQLLAALLFPRLLVAADSWNDNEPVTGRRVFREYPPWHQGGDTASPPVVVSEVDTLRIAPR